MKHTTLIACLVLMTGCTAAPIIDPKASTNPHNLIEDRMACEYLADQASIWDKTPYIVHTCLEGRGHSVVNYHGGRR